MRRVTYEPTLLLFLFILIAPNVLARPQGAEPAPQGVQAANSGSGTGSASKASTTSRPLGDYVRCLFDEEEMYGFRVQPHSPATDTPLDQIASMQVAQAVNAIFVSAARRQGINPNRSGPSTKYQDGKTDVIVPDPNILRLADSITPELFKDKLPSGVPQIVLDLAKKLGADNKLNDDDKQRLNSVALQSISAVKGAVSTLNPQTFPTPDDVSCSFSILQWHETSDTFGRRVANDYVALQVTVRNLNQQNEFLIHDIQVAVDTGLNAKQFGRFQAARDKLIVRNVAQRGQSDDRRNLIINTLVAAGAVSGGASTAVTQSLAATDAAVDLSSAVAIFQGPFIAGLINIFPDHTIEQINHINDLAFSASSSSKTIVPVQGSVPLVTFLASKPLEQLPFARCGNSTKSLFFSTVDTNDAGASEYQYCDATKEEWAYPPKYYFKAYAFRKWQPAALSILERRVFVVIGGVHIQELSGGPTIDTVNCLMAQNGVDLSHQSNGIVSCTLTGNRLDKATGIKLEGASTFNATIAPSANGDTATMGLSAADFSKASGNYEIFLTQATGGDIDSKLGLNFTNRQPSGLTFSPSTLPAGTSFSVTITGQNLDRIQNVDLDFAGPPETKILGSMPVAGSVTSSTPAITVTFSQADIVTLKAALAAAPVGPPAASAQLEVTAIDGTVLKPEGATAH